MRKPISVIVSWFIFLHLRLSLYDFDTYEVNSLTACLNSSLFLKWSFFGSLSVSIKMISLPSAVQTPAKKIDKKLHVFISILRGIQRTSLRPDRRAITLFHFTLKCYQKWTKKAKIRQLQMNVLALIFKTHYETLKLYTVLSLNNEWISSHIGWTLTLHC